jgi:DNA-directed RNA polymerase specialized sigma24 family protein
MRGDGGDKGGKRERSEHEAEFREYMASLWGDLVRFAFGLTGDRGHAEDPALTALAKAYASWPRVRRADDPAPFSTSPRRARTATRSSACTSGQTAPSPPSRR